MYKLGIIIINYEAEEDTLECLKSVEQFASSLKPYVLLIDNSEDRCLAADVLEQFEFDGRFIANATNRGFAAAVNQGLSILQTLDCTYFLLLNNDIVLVDRSLEVLAQFLDRHLRTGVVGGTNYYYARPKEIWQTGFNLNWWKGGVKKMGQLRVPTEVDYVPGSVFMGRLSLISEIGMLDENYFMYFEETDWCFRLRKKNYRVYYLPNTTFLHKSDGHDRKDVPQIFYYMTRNECYFHDVHNAGLRKYFTLTVLLGHNGLRAIKYAVQNSNASPTYLYFKAYFYGVKHFFHHKMGRFTLS